MPKSIKMSPKHGLNPAMTKCFWCGKEDGIALMGRLPHDEKAPDTIIAGYAPCKECQEHRKEGITLIGVLTEQPADGRPAIAEGLYPTGSWAVISEHAVNRLFTPDVRKSILDAKGAMIPENILKNISSHITPKEEGDTAHE